MDNQQLRNQIASMRDSLIEQGHLDVVFVELEELENDSKPHLAEEVLTFYLSDYVRITDGIETSLRQIQQQFEKLVEKIGLIQGSSASVGAAKVLEESKVLVEFCKKGNAEGCFKTLERMKQEYVTLKEKLGIYFQLTRQVGGSEGGGN